MSILFPIIYILLANTTFVIIFNKKFGRCLPLTLMCSAFSLFISQFLFNTFNIGFYFNLLFMIFPIIWILLNLKNGKLKNLKNNYFTSGFWTTIILYVLVILFDLNRSFSAWDEFSHWGVMLKEMLRIDHFYTVDASTLMVHKEYPPIVQIFELFWIKLCGSYTETNAIRSLHFLELSMFIPFLEKAISNKKDLLRSIIKTISLFFVVVLTLIFFDQHNIVNCIYIDYFMAILVAYIVTNIFIEDNLLSPFSMFNICASTSFLLLTKQIGLTLYLMVLFLLFGILILNKIKNQILIDKKKIIDLCVLILIVMVIPLSFYKSWDSYIKKYDTDAQFVISDIKLTKLPKIIMNTDGELYQQQSANNYINAIKTKSITTSYVSLTYVQSVILGLLILYLIFKIYKDENIKKKILLFVTLILGALGYAFVMLNMYVFCFGDREGPALASYDRYMSTFVLIILFICIMLYYFKNKSQRKYELPTTLIILSVIFMLQAPSALYKVYPAFINIKSTNVYENNANVLKNYVRENDKVFQIAQNTLFDYQYFVHYYISYVYMNIDNYNFNVADNINYEKYFNDDIKKYMIEYDYVYLALIDEEFIEKYSFLFEDDDIKNGQLYKINYVNNKLKLKHVN